MQADKQTKTDKRTNRHTYYTILHLSRGQSNKKNKTGRSVTQVDRSFQISNEWLKSNVFGYLLKMEIHGDGVITSGGLVCCMKPNKKFNETN